MILSATINSSRLINYFVHNIAIYDKDKHKGLKFDKIFLGINEIDVYNLSEHVKSESTLFVDLCTESGQVHTGLVENNLYLKNIYNCNIVYIIDNIGGNITDFSKDNNLNIFSSRYFSFYSYLTFTYDSFSLFANNNFDKSINHISNYDRRYIFISRNGRFTDYRFYLVYKLAEKMGISGLYDDNLVSGLFYTNTESCVTDLKRLDRKYTDNIDFDFYKMKLKPILPVKFDGFLKDGGIFADIRGDLHYENDCFNSYFDVVTENTTIDDEKYDICTITEKTLKPFIGLQIPILILQKKSYKYLKELGFDLFEDLLGVEYYEMDEVDKINYVVDFLYNIDRKTIREYFEKNFFRIQNNKNTLIDLAFIQGKLDLNKFIEKYNLID